MRSSARGQSRRELTNAPKCRAAFAGAVSSGPASSALIGSDERREGGCNSKSKFAFDQPSGFSRLLPPPHQSTIPPTHHNTIISSTITTTAALTTSFAAALYLLQPPRPVYNLQLRQPCVRIICPFH
ncbi:hypothetical protein E4U34_005454 [Claviceps purpurea]|nr:hypothetical protein E4U34_005454 [Claviceps purpurea]